MIKAVLIDIDDTLLDFKLCSKQSVKNVCQKTGVPFSEEFMTVFYEVTSNLWKKIETRELTKPELYDIRFNTVFSRLGVSGDGELFEKLYHEELYESDIMIEGAKELLENLSKKFTVCAASNAPYGQQFNRLKKTGLLPYFTHIFVSGEIGFDKPSKEFFDYALNILKIKADEAIMIGDSMSADIKGGVTSGLHTCLFNRTKNTPTGDFLPEYTVENLSDIPKLSLLS